MAQPTNTYDTYDVTGNLDDIEDLIYDISPTETPFVSAIERGKAENTLHEWQTDALAAATKDNAVIEGDDVSGDAQVATNRIGNYTQLMDKAITTTSTQRAVKSAGRKDEMGYLVAKAGRELKRDIEAAASGENHAVAGTSSAARKLGGAEVWIATAAKHGAGGSTTETTSGAPTATKLTDGTQRALTEDEFLAAWQLAWTEGGNPTLVLAGAFNKRRMSTFTGNATKTKDIKDKKLVAAVDIYVGDFGTAELVASRFNRTRTVLGLDPEYWKLSVLQAMKKEDLAKTGHADKKLLSTELTLVCGNQRSSFKVADLTTA